MDADKVEIHYISQDKENPKIHLDTGKVTSSHKENHNIIV